MDAERLYAELSELVRTMPRVAGRRLPPSTEDHRWYGRLIALLQAQGWNLEVAQLRTAWDSLGTIVHDQSAAKVVSTLFAAQARAELEAPIGARGAFIPAGDGFGGLTAIADILRGATSSAMIVDAYLDERLLSDFAVMLQPGVVLLALADENGLRPGLRPAAERWLAQYPDRPIDIRVAPARALHDRAIFIDGDQAWTVSQSLKDIATRSPALIQRVDAGLAADKLAAYQAMFDAAKPLI